MPTDNKETKDSLDQIVGNKLRTFEEAPSLEAWANISKQIGVNPPATSGYVAGKNIFFFTATALILIAAVIFIFSRNKEMPTKAATEQRPLEIKNNNPTTMEAPLENTGTHAPVESNTKLPNQATGSNYKTSENKNQIPEENTSPEKAAVAVEQIPKKAPAENDSPTNTAIAINKSLPDSSAQLTAPDTLKKIAKPKSFYEKKLKDSSLKYQQLFKKN